jgi:hypothetical protein
VGFLCGSGFDAAGGGKTSEGGTRDRVARHAAWVFVSNLRQQRLQIAEERRNLFRLEDCRLDLQL